MLGNLGLLFFLTLPLCMATDANDEMPADSKSIPVASPKVSAAVESKYAVKAIKAAADRMESFPVDAPSATQTPEPNSESAEAPVTEQTEATEPSTSASENPTPQADTPLPQSCPNCLENRRRIEEHYRTMLRHRHEIERGLRSPTPCDEPKCSTCKTNFMSGTLASLFPRPCRCQQQTCPKSCGQPTFDSSAKVASNSHAPCRPCTVQQPKKPFSNPDLPPHIVAGLTMNRIRKINAANSGNEPIEVVSVKKRPKPAATSTRQETPNEPKIAQQAQPNIESDTPLPEVLTAKEKERPPAEESPFAGVPAADINETATDSLASTTLTESTESAPQERMPVTENNDAVDKSVSTAPASKPIELALPKGDAVSNSHAADYTWIEGKLERFYVRGGGWIVRYQDHDQLDRFGGRVHLSRDIDMSKFQEGDLVRVRGFIDDEQPGKRRGDAPEYQVIRMTLISRGEQPETN